MQTGNFNTIFARIGNKPFLSLIDTGSAISVLSTRAFRSLVPHSFTKVDCESPTLFSASGQAISLSHTIETTFCVDGLKLPFTFHVADNLSVGHDVIIGFDFLSKYDCVIDIGNRLISFCDGLTVVPLQNRNRTDTATLITDVVIPPRAEAILSVKLPRCVDNVNNVSIFLLQPVESLHAHCLSMARAVIQPLQGKANCRLINPTNTTVSLKRGTVVGTIEPLSVNSITPLNEHFNSNDDNDRRLIENADDILADLGVDLSKSALQKPDLEKLKQLIAANADVFAKDMSQLGEAKGYIHHIDTGDAPPQRSRIYRTSPAQKAEIDKQVQDLLKHGIIEKSNSLWQCPVVLVKRTTGNDSKTGSSDATGSSNISYRFCCDFRALNRVSKDIFHYLPVWEDVIDAIGNVKPEIFSVLDFRMGFHQIPVDDYSKERCSFVTETGTYSYRRLPFGVKSGTVAFQAMITSLFRDVLFKYMICYVDDLVLFSHSPRRTSQPSVGSIFSFA